MRTTRNPSRSAGVLRPADGSPRRIAPVILLLGSITAIGPMSIDLYLPAFPGLTASLHASESMVQLTLTTFLIGLAVGQLFVGPLSDVIGRRRPLLVGMAAYAMASAFSALAPNVELLAVGRALQGLSGAAGAVLAQALVRDLFDGPLVARVMSRLMLVMGVAPVLAPTLGGQLLRWTGWRGLFWVLTAFGIVMTGVVAVFVRETLAPERRARGGLAGTIAAYRGVASDRRYLAYAGIAVLGFVLIFGYVSGSPFAYQKVHGVSPEAFGLLFGLNSIAMVVASQVNARLVLRVSPERVLRRVVPATLIAAATLFVTVLTGAFGLAGLAIPLFAMMATIGLVLPNAGALALERHPEAAGSAAALTGTAQFALGSAVAPVIGAFGSGTALPMATVILIGGTGMVLTAALLGRTPAPAAAQLPHQDRAEPTLYPASTLDPAPELASEQGFARSEVVEL